MTFEDLQKANETIKTLDVKGKEYAEVNQRIKAFRMLYPEGTIETEMLSNENGVCVFKASVYTNRITFDDIVKFEKILLGTGTAYERENSSFINKTSYIENCETSAVGRALAMCGIGIDTSIASAEEVANAINNQEPTKEEALAFVFENGKHKGKSIDELYEGNKDYLQWWLDQGKDERIKKMIMLITDMKPTPIPSEEEQQERLQLLADMSGLIEITNTDYEKLLEHYKVKSNAEMTIEQLKDAISILKEKLV